MILYMCLLCIITIRTSPSFKRKVLFSLMDSKIYTVSRDGALFVWSCSKDIDDIEMKDKNNMDEGTGLKLIYINTGKVWRNELYV